MSQLISQLLIIILLICSFVEYEPRWTIIMIWTSTSITKKNKFNTKIFLSENCYFHFLLSLLFLRNNVGDLFNGLLGRSRSMSAYLFRTCLVNSLIFFSNLCGFWCRDPIDGPMRIYVPQEHVAVCGFDLRYVVISRTFISIYMLVSSIYIFLVCVLL